MRAKRASACFPVILAAGFVAVLLAGAGCDEIDRPGEPEQARFEAYETFPTSLHATAEGMRTVFNMDGEGPYDDGFGTHTGKDYETMGCKMCHEWGSFVPRPPRDTCDACHLDNRETEDHTCYACHKRQFLMNDPSKLAESDVHRSMGMTCVECHKLEELHGDGTPYKSQFEVSDETRVTCQDCHTKIRSTASHDAHLDAEGNRKLDCSACHSRTVMACYNCHLDHGSVHQGMKKDWLFLMNDDRTGRVRAATFQSVSTHNSLTSVDKFIGFAPFEAHTTMPRGRECDACHGNTNAAIDDFNTNGSIKVTEWDTTTTPHDLWKLDGVIPVIGPDASGDERMIFDYLEYDPDGDSWSELVTTGDTAVQHIYGSHLTDAQLACLTAPKFPDPSITRIWPKHGDPAGGYTLTILGRGFWSKSEVTIGGTDATNVVVVNSWKITCEVPSGTSDTDVDVVVDNYPTEPTAPEDTLVDGFHYD